MEQSIPALARTSLNLSKQKTEVRVGGSRVLTTDRDFEMWTP